MFDEEESFGLSLNLKSDKLLLSLLKMLLCISRRQKGHETLKHTNRQSVMRSREAYLETRCSLTYWGEKNDEDYIL